VLVVAADGTAFAPRTPPSDQPRPRREVPIVVAINKIDKGRTASPEMGQRQEASNQQLRR